MKSFFAKVRIFSIIYKVNKLSLKGKRLSYSFRRTSSNLRIQARIRLVASIKN